MAAPIRPVIAADLAELTRMLGALWPDGREAHYAYARRRINGTPDSEFLAVFPRAIWVAERKPSGLAGFIEVGLRSHAEGCHEGRAIGYIEGWWVDPDARNRRLGAALMAAATRWAKARGCVELASDARLDNAGSQRAHLALGFGEQQRLVAFRKRLT